MGDSVVIVSFVGKTKIQNEKKTFEIRFKKKKKKKLIRIAEFCET